MQINHKDLINLELGEKISQIEFNDGFSFSFDPGENPIVTEIIETEESYSVVIKLDDLTREQLERIPDELIRRLKMQKEDIVPINLRSITITKVN
jgi:hypothetical protein